MGERNGSDGDGRWMGGEEGELPQVAECAVLWLELEA